MTAVISISQRTTVNRMTRKSKVQGERRRTLLFQLESSLLNLLSGFIYHNDKQRLRVSEMVGGKLTALCIRWEVLFLFLMSHSFLDIVMI